MSETRPIAVEITPLETRRDVVVDVARRAEELGYTAVYVAEGWGHDAAVLLAEIALKTTRIRTETARSTSGAAPRRPWRCWRRVYSDLSQGRFELGLGRG